ncbi:DUF1796 family putative cysteine peptidase [Sodalis glossinidius]|uniref:DUF1796 family putative cysteine peptidase n=1 Tax=Sodalis glossinidius TaxID=63612 RepID=UPI0013050C25|nr:DUF1796 family putative cysteine peptidase [Sodalis glossinidius]
MKILDYLYVKTINYYYCKILDRPADTQGMETWLKSFRKDYFFYACRNINSVLKNSEEYKHNKGIVHNAIHIPFGDKLINGVEVNHIVSLGSHCLAASILKKLGIKKYSLPFDWNFTHPGMVIDCLNDNFKVFLDKKYHKSIQVIRESGIIDQCASHTYYEKKYKTVETFNHR